MTTWRRGVFASASAVLLATSVAVPALAASTSNTSQAKQQQASIGKQLSQLKSQENEVSGEESDLLDRLDDLNNRKADLDHQTANLQTQMNGVQSQLDAAQSQLNQLQQQEDQAQSDLAVAQSALDASAAKMRDQAVDAYVGNQPSQNLAAFVLKADDMREVSAASEYLNQIVESRRAVVEQHRELQGQAKDLAKKIDAARAQAQSARDTIGARQSQLAAQKAQLDTLNQQAADEADQQKALLTEVAAKKADIADQMASLQAQSDSIAALLRGIGTGGGTAPPPGKGVLANPVPGAPLTSPFGMRLDPVTGVYQLHAGQDFGVPTGTAIRAAGDGTVVSELSTAQSGGYGNYTCINHGGGMATCYAHQSQFLVTVGQHVARNQIIGLSGSTGYATGPHLHFEVRINGNPVNPIPYL